MSQVTQTSNEVDNPTKQTMSSIEIAELTGKQHKNVLRDIRNTFSQLAKEEGVGSDLSYLSNQGVTTVFGTFTKQVASYNLTRFASDIVIAGYSVKYRAAIIKRWHELENQQSEYYIPKDYAGALQLSADLAKKLIVLQDDNQEQSIKIEQDAPKVDLYEKFMNTEGLYTVTDVGDMMGISGTKLNILLRFNFKWLWKTSGRFKLTTKAKDNDYMVAKNVICNDGKTRKRVLITQAGMEHILVNKDKALIILAKITES